MAYTQAAWERAMKIQEVMLKALAGEIHWFRAAEILGMSARALRRWRVGFEKYGYTGLLDGRRRVPSIRRAPIEEVEKILRLYRETYLGWNVRHFHQTVRREFGVKLSYTSVKKLLQEGGLIRKLRSRGRHRRKRERRAQFGEMLHMDGSRHPWLGLMPEERQTLIQVVDDATSRVLYAQLWPGETTRAVMATMCEVVREHGIPESLYTDRAGWAFETPKAGGKVDKAHRTQFGESLARLGVEHIPSYSPQARGRSERMNRTLQDRLVNELRVAKITTVEAANVYLRDRYIPTHNQELAVEPSDSDSAFVELGNVDLDEIFFEEAMRTVGKDNTVSVDGLTLQIEKLSARRTCAGLAVQIRRHLHGGYTVRRGTQLLGAYDAGGRLQPLAAGKPTHQDAPGSTQAARVDTKVVPAINTYRPSRGRGRAGVPASGRLRLPPSGTPPLRVASKG